MKVNDGSAGAPGISFIADPDTGLWRPGANRMQLVVGGTARWEINATGDLVPVATATYDLGSTAAELQEIYANEVSTTGGTDWATHVTPYVPALTATVNPNLGSTGTITGNYFRFGNWIQGWVDAQFGGVGVAAGTGAYRISVPVNMSTSVHGLRTPGGIAFYRDSSASANTSGQDNYQTTSTLALKDESGQDVTDSNPWVWATGDEIHIEFHYAAA